MPMQWNSEANTRLFLGVLEQCKNTKMNVDYKGLAAFMGPECTPKAVRLQLAKLKGQAGGNSSTPATPTATPTPKKRKSGAEGQSPKTPTKKSKGQKAQGGSDEDEDTTQE
ncbi:hypothetical protein ASPWEDRAFT_177606 [Aspergillus wentii DTO 134E9]|uniref:Uncharacterized protein n=1 Tax=Aspergillus wentii DTO 134E9 TaxID=1073089 RepID=A0A1L9R4Q9_ASPWE|nr:uncharacterized protein ASPWEDRAFT_177606 [Aspergillus wentii DTO 134E9]KAI9927145.1 hypothetical protein MW887_003528 [Aspergillus wentii]OJJ29873.1 hypothetical protein ASPWEDRAFT_177606 [Aspergillus wentii DTO 134E9]